jgi:phage shock protein A
MSEETTHNLPDSRSFEERVFARFDAVDAGLRDLNARVEKLENESERRAADTKPIWERALAEIAAVRQDVAALSQKVEALDKKVDVLTKRVEIIEHKMDALASDMLTLRGRQSQVEVRVDKLESKPVT